MADRAIVRRGSACNSRSTRPALRRRRRSSAFSANIWDRRARHTRCSVFVDSHCHLDFPELREDLPQVLEAMRDNGVTHALTIAVEKSAWPAVHAIAREHPNLYASVGVHPDQESIDEPTEAELVARAGEAKVVAIGETGLDYYRLTGDLGWQRDRFRTHIRAARTAGKPLVIHTRASAADTL